MSLGELDRRAALQRRTDRKYLLRQDLLAEILRDLTADHQALEIDGRRRFGYENVYFDTPELRCFFDHVEDRYPRFKVRTRLYVDSGKCEFEVKLSRAKGETDKHSIELDRDACGTVTPEGDRLAREVTDLSESDELRRVLGTEFSRMTIVARGEAERVTIDVGISLLGVSGGEAELARDLALVETKTRDGNARADELMRTHGVESLSLSKYRLGVALLERPGADQEYVRDRKGCFRVVPAG